jgi:hypothetical protein
MLGRNLLVLFPLLMGVGPRPREDMITGLPSLFFRKMND